MKNVQVIDGADNCAYDVFAATEKEFALLFPNGRDIEFINDFVERVGDKVAGEVTSAMWDRIQDKMRIKGIHGTLFYELDFKKEYYPSKKESDLDLRAGERGRPRKTNLTQAAEAGDIEAQVHFAALLATGDGAEKDTERAAYWYRKAAAKKHPEALYNLGLMYVLGETKKGTRERGHALIEDAADRGSWDANWFLGQVYLKGGYGLKKDSTRAAYHMVHALGCRSGNAALSLGLALKESGGMKASALSEAFVHVAARLGDDEALGLVSPDMARKLMRDRKRRR